MITPPHLRKFALVRGVIPSAPLDLPQRLNGIVAALQREGWQVSVRSVGTDFAGPAGMPVPKNQPIEVYLFRAAPPFTASDASDAVNRAIYKQGMQLQVLGAYLTEVGREVVAPTVRQLAQGLRTGGGFLDRNLKWAVVGLGLVWLFKR